MKNLAFLPFLLLTFLLLDGCKKEDEFCDDPTNRQCPNFDPCTLAVAANSDFKIVNTISFGVDTVINIEVDTAYGGSSNTAYQADIQEGLAYAWKVGADPRTFQGPELSLNFTGFIGNVAVTLETTTLDSLGCIPESEMRTTKTKNIYYTDLSIPYSIHGVFRGKVLGEAGELEYDVEVENTFSYSRLHGLPLPDDCTFDGRGIPLSGRFQCFVSTFLRDLRTPRCRNLTVVGRINLEDRDELRIEYVYDDDAGRRKTKVFVGRRL
jgi:hypothetical protein